MTVPDVAPVRGLARARSLPLAGFLLSEAVSWTGTRLSMIAVPWLVLTTTGSAGRTGLAAFAEMAPLVVCKASSGPVIDRLGARRVSVACDLSSVVAVGLIPVLHALGALSFGALLVLVAVAGALRGPGDSAKAALVPVLADHSRVPLERVTGFSGAIERSATFLGAAAAGGLVTWLGVTGALVADAASFGLCALLLAVSVASVDGSDERQLRGPVDEPTAEPADERAVEVTTRTSYLDEWREGWDFLRRDRVLIAMAVMVATTNLLDQSFSAVLLPVWVREHGYGVGTVGTYFAVWAAASAVGAVTAAWLAQRLPRFRVYVVAFLVTGLPRFLVFAFVPAMPLVLAVGVVGGLFSGFLNPILGAVIFERIPRPVLGRVSSLLSSLCWALIPFGGLLGGALVVTAGLTPALVVVGIAYLAATMLPVLIPSFRSFDREPLPPRKIEKSVTRRVSARITPPRPLRSSSTRG
jgi:MFS family permease